MSTFGTQYVATPDEILGGGSVVLLAKGCAETLERHYPGWLWTISPDAKQGLINISSQLLNTAWVYTLHISRIQNDPTMKAALIAGGELLERFGFRRGPYRPDEWNAKRGEQRAGRLLPVVTDKGRFEQRRAKIEKIRGEVASGAARILTDQSIGAALAAAGIR